MIFRELLTAAQRKNKSTLAIGLAPTMNSMPALIAHYDDPFLPFGKLVIDTTADLVCAYVFHLSAYLSAGASGAVALERTMAYVPAGILKILHGPFASSDYVSAAFEDGFGANAVTLAAHLEPSHVIPYLEQSSHGVFVNALPEVSSLEQDYPDRFGCYRQTEATHIELSLSSAPSLTTHWYWGRTIYPSRAGDFIDALYAAATALRGKSAS